MAILAYDDVMLREPRLLVPGMLPVGNIRIDWSGIASWLDYVFLFGISPPSKVFERPGLAPITYALTAGASLGTGPNGKCLRASGTNDNGATLSSNIFATSTCSIFWGDDGASTTGVITTSAHYTQGSVYGLQTRIHTDGTIYIVKQNVALALSAAGRRSNAFNGCGVTIKGDYDVNNIFCNGVLMASDNPVLAYVHGTSRIGDQGEIGGYVPLNGPLYHVYFSSRCVPDSVAAELTRDPYQILTVA